MTMRRVYGARFEQPRLMQISAQGGTGDVAGIAGGHGGPHGSGAGGFGGIGGGIGGSGGVFDIIKLISALSGIDPSQRLGQISGGPIASLDAAQSQTPAMYRQWQQIAQQRGGDPQQQLAQLLQTFNMRRTASPSEWQNYASGASTGIGTGAIAGAGAGKLPLPQIPQENTQLIGPPSQVTPQIPSNVLTPGPQDDIKRLLTGGGGGAFGGSNR